jgi:GDPmannose 4,6-dehydratase
MKTALICGVSGQDGAYLSKLLLSKGYVVYGGSRDIGSSNFDNLKKLNVFEYINLVSISVNDFRSVLQVIMKIKPNEIYNLAGQSSVALSFEQPVETMESISFGTLNLLEAIRFSKLEIKFYSAGSSECFGNSPVAVDENTPFRPRSPYGVAKATAFWEVANYREAYNLFACTGILFNHESPLRKERFVTKKIVATACRIAKGSNEKLILGNINIHRDWGWAPEYVMAMWLMLQQEKPDDFIIATGTTMSLKEFVTTTFEYLNLRIKDHVRFDEDLLRPTDIEKGYANATKAKKILNWEAKIKSNELVKMMVDCEINKIFI